MFGRFIGSLIYDLRRTYAISLALILLFPPINYNTKYTTHVEFVGWDFITTLGGGRFINITYLIIEIAFVTTIFFLFRNKKK